MEQLDLLFDICFAIVGIVCTVFVVVKRKSFDLFTALLTCGGWITYGIRLLMFDYVIVSLKTMQNTGGGDDIGFLMIKSSILLNVLDALVLLLLSIALVRIVVKGLFLRWYNKAIRRL